MLRSVLSIILGGGQGARLFPLTQLRAKPAVPVAGKYRLIDIPISNCLNSGINRIYVMTQFLSASLHRHIANTYKFDQFSKGFVEILAAQQTMEGSQWYQGTADAVRQNVRQIEEDPCTDVLILSGDQLYRMDYSELQATHTKSDADITIAMLPVPESHVAGFGIMKADDSGRITSFIEKPKVSLKEHEPFRTNAEWIEARGIKCDGRNYLASMGIYLFKREVLLKLLQDPQDTDFGRDIFQKHYKQLKVQAHLFDGYWEDLGTIRSYLQSSLDLARENPKFEFYHPSGPIYTRMRFLPAARICGATINESLISDGCVVKAGTKLNHCSLGVRSRIGQKCEIIQSVIIGADRYESDEERESNARKSIPNFNVGDNCHIERAILDKDCRVGNNVTIDYHGKEPNVDGDCYYIRDGIVVIPKGMIVPDGTVI
ncbi:glucose-1-phosphate adenylyltransferase [Zavarzinella formosa]|uniref:glucose-1-phosphate adenylyltransferase n=1 Tax=Zavarzinella formosa TaxID=360055 RepID=UPI00031D87F6|nr:glucose-1-phosphate adenylyltransferase [Zavarzinella formosa]